MSNFFFYQNDKAIINNEVVLSDEQKFWKKHTYMRFALMKHSRAINNRETDWNIYQKQYEAWRPPKSADDWQSNIVPPYTTSVVEASLSEMIDQTLQPQVGARKREYVPAATVLNHIKDYTWELGFGDFELYKAIKQNLILGTTVWQEYYCQEKRKVQQVISYDAKSGREEYKEVEIYDFDDVYGEAINLWEIWFDPAARSINMGSYKAQDAIRRYVMHIDNFRNTIIGSKWDMFKNANKIKPGGDTNYYQFYQPDKGIDSGSFVELLFHWIRNPDKLTIFANDVPIYIGPNPFNHKQLPFGATQDVVNSWGVYGKGEPALMESIQDELTTNRRMRLDRQKMDIYKMIFVSNREAISDGDLIPAPMKPVYVDDVNNVKAFEYGDVNPSAYREELLLKEDAARVTGVDDRQMSAGKPASTATDAAIMKEATLKRLRMKIWVISRTLLLEQIRQRVSNIIQYYQTPKVTDIYGKDAYEKMIKIRELASEQRLVKQGGKFMELEYKTIVTKNKALKREANGEVSVLDNRGDNFFMVTPDLLGPSSSVFNYKLSAEPTFPLSKPLMQQKVSEFMNSPIIQLAIQTGYYDPTKLADKFTDTMDFDPEDFKSQPKEDQSGQLLIDPAKMLEQASKENEIMARGEPLIGTPYSTPEHTQVHLAFMQSTAFKEKATPEILKIFAKHIMEEATSQMMRQKQLGNSAMSAPAQPAPAGADSTMAIQSGMLKNIMPGKQVGPENVPQAQGGAMSALSAFTGK